MILIFSIDGDESTNAVIDLLQSAKYKRINKIALSNSITINDSESYTISAFVDLINDAKCYYFRKKPLVISETQSAQVSHIQKSEFLQIIEYVLYTNNMKPRLGSWNQDSINRLIVSNLAKVNNLLVPFDSFISSKQEIVELEKSKNIRFITKNISFSAPQQVNQDVYNPLTSIVDSEQVPSTFFPSYVQEFIHKEFDIRSFYLDGEFYSTAIFSQNESETSVDYRNYNYEVPARQIRYKLPDKIDQNVKRLCKSLGLNTGSIDFVKDLNSDNIYFLEINPSGQFGSLSYTGNYNIEGIIANWLITRDE